MESLLADGGDCDFLNIHDSGGLLARAGSPTGALAVRSLPSPGWPCTLFVGVALDNSRPRTRARAAAAPRPRSPAVA